MWSSSRRRARLPKNWDEIRLAQLKADGYRCTEIEYGERCPETTNLEVDHLVAEQDDHSRLTTLCKAHHARKSAREGHEAKARKRAKTSSKFRRESEVHPSSWR